MSKTYKITGNDAARLAQRENLTVGDNDGVEPCWNDASISESDVSDYLSGLSAEARADWAAGRIDEVMADHSTSHFGREINDQIRSVAAAL